MTYTYDDITFIVPIKIDSDIRLINFYYSMMYLKTTHNFKIIVKEVDHEPKLSNIINKIDNPNLKYVFENIKENEKNNFFFHRTKYLNDMIELCDTKIICNFDCDILLQKKNIDQSLNLFNEGVDVVYPYNYGNYQLRIYNHDIFKIDGFFNFVQEFNNNNVKTEPWTSAFGHCVMFKSDVYKKGFGENEEFKSYGPEDFERYNRFKKLNFNVKHLNCSTDSYYILHMEHPRGKDSDDSNLHFKYNELLRTKLESLNKEELINEYNMFKYVTERNWKLI